MLAARPPPALLFAVVLGVILFLFVSRDASVPGPSASAAGDPLDARALAASFPPSNCPANPERLKFPVSARRSYPDKHKEVRGWVKPGVPHLFALLAAHQAKLGICGGVAEIGVHHGKLAIILAHTLRKSERMVAVDVFENQALNVDGSGKGDRGIFESNLKKFGIQPNSDVEIISSSSMEVSVQQLESAVGKIRMFSVDGGHTAELTAWDMGLATGACVDGCIVAVDDAMAVYWWVGGVRSRGARRRSARIQTTTQIFLYFCRSGFGRDGAAQFTPF